MEPKRYEFAIVFEKLREASEGEDYALMSKEEYNEIRVLREITAEIQTPAPRHFTST
jgi:hypothetical protein